VGQSTWILDARGDGRGERLSGFRLEASGLRLEASGFRLEASGLRLQA
jgi:hypothetical protein